MDRTGPLSPRRWPGGLAGAASGGEGAATRLLGALPEDLLDPVALLLQALELGHVGLPGLVGLLLRLGAEVDQGRHLLLGGRGLRLETLLRPQVLGRRLAFGRDLGLGLLDLLLLHGEQRT